MRYIIVIKGVSQDEYIRIRQDMIGQIMASPDNLSEYCMPLFAWLPIANCDDHPEIEVIWIDKGFVKD